MAIRTFGKFSAMSGILKITIITLIAIFGFGIYEFTLPIFIEGQSNSFSIVGIIVSLVFAASMLMEVPVGLAVDKYGRTKIMLAAATIIGILGIVYFFINSLIIFAFLSLVFGAVSVAFWVPSAVLVRDLSPLKMRSLAEGIYMGITQIGWVAAPIIAGIITTSFSDKHNFLLVSVFLFAAAGLGFLALMRRKTNYSKKAVSHSHKARLTLLATVFKEYLKIHKYAPFLYALGFAVNIWVAIEWAFVPLSGIERFGFSAETMGLVLGAMMGVEGALYYSSGYIMDKIGKRYIITAGFLLLFSSAYFMFLSNSPSMFILATLFAAAVPAWVLPGIEAMLTDILPANLYGEMSGAFYTSQDFGFVIGPLAAGIIATQLNNPLAPFLLVAIAAAVATLIAGYIFWPEQKDIKIKRLFAKN